MSPPPSVSERLLKPEENGYITGSYATVDPKELEKEIFALVLVTVDSSRQCPQFPEHTHSHDEILE